MKKRILLLIAGVFLLPKPSFAIQTKMVSSLLSFPFSTEGLLQESGSINNSSSPYWWVNSGGYLKLDEGRGSTAQGSLAATDPWRLLYSASSPADTDQGYHPQNLFRLVTRQNTWKNLRQEAYFKISKDNLSASSNRNASNGLLLFNRYQDGMNLYYTGVRVDGSAVIKKKKGGTYTTLTQKFGIYPGTYNESAKKSLLPKDTWIGLRSELKNNADGSVNIKLYMDKGWTGKWKLVAEATDKSSPITGAGSGGIRTDFMDVKFDGFKLSSI